MRTTITLSPNAPSPDAPHRFTVRLGDPSAGSTGTLATAINASGVVVGDYLDSSGTHGFIYNNGGYTNLTDPSAASTTTLLGFIGPGTGAIDINDSGDVVGDYSDSFGTEHGFAWIGRSYRNRSRTTADCNNHSNLAAKEVLSQCRDTIRLPIGNVPIVFNSGTDPVRLGLVASFNRPGGTVTGVFAFVSELVTKNLGLLHELVPKAAMIAVLTSNPLPAEFTAQEREAHAAAAQLGEPCDSRRTPFALLARHCAELDLESG